VCNECLVIDAKKADKGLTMEERQNLDEKLEAHKQTASLRAMAMYVDLRIQTSKFNDPVRL
jgi:hypothetical protein